MRRGEPWTACVGQQQALERLHVGIALEPRPGVAWVRTAITVMAFGFIVEKFDLFLELAAPSLAGRTLSLSGQKFR
jgi:uncharacterized membrane protein YidH (DUF202 family)